MNRVLVTGGTGFLGTRLVAALRARAISVRVLTRRAPPRAPGIEYVVGDLTNPAACATALDGCDAVIHAAAATGRVSAQEHFRVNAVGTAALLAAARAAGVGRFILVSSIAVKFENVRHYPYARAKREAEAAVRRGAVPWTIIRPTILTGPGAPVLQGLRRLAALPVVPVFGTGRARVQPVWVEEAADAVVALALHPDATGATVDVGGPDVVSIETLLLELHRELRGTPGRAIHLPLRPLAWVLAGLEPLAAGRLPLTAGQLSTFREDGLADPHPLLAGHRPQLALAEQLRRSVRA